jgi:hypothetical protein
VLYSVYITIRYFLGAILVQNSFRKKVIILGLFDSRKVKIVLWYIWFEEPGVRVSPVVPVFFSLNYDLGGSEVKSSARPTAPM